MSSLNLNIVSPAFRNIILNKKHNLEYMYDLNGDDSTHTQPAFHYEPSLESPNVPFLTDYHPKLLEYTKNLNVRGATDGYFGNVRRGNYPNQWDKRGDNIIIADVNQQINEPSDEIKELWSDPTRNNYNSYLDYTNAIFMKDSSPSNVLAGILTGDGVGISSTSSGLSIVSDFNIQQTLAGRLYSTITGKDTRLGKIGMKAAGISMANNVLRKSGKMFGGVVKEGVQFLLSKITNGKLGDEKFELAKYASPSITDAPGIGDNILSSTGIGGVLNTVVGDLGIGDLLGNNNWSRTATASNDGKYIQIGIDGVLVEYRENIKPDFDKYISGNIYTTRTETEVENNINAQTGEVEGTTTRYNYIPVSESEYRRLQQTELIDWSGILTKELIYQNLSKNKYQPGYVTNKKSGQRLEYNDYQQSLNEIGYGANIDDSFLLGTGKNEGILQVENDVRIKNKRQIYTWAEKKSGSTPIQSNSSYDDAVYNGIDNSNIGFFNSGINNISNPNTLLSKTKKLFESGKIKTIVSSFYQLDSPSEIQSAVSQFGISKGRNLLNKSASSGKTPNDYDDPYCRVWTWERQYRNVQNAIRPFLSPSSENDPGNEGEPIKMEDLHRQVEHIRPNLEVFSRFTSLQDNGLPKIAPYKSDFVNIDGNGKVISGWTGEIKDRRNYNRNYFFSIENLAWKDLPIEDILCPSQCGPNGGRIYWFSPLNLDFDETTSVNLNREDFIGRGEQVITYVNSIRTGNLSFTMVVDHSSFMEFMKYRDFNDGDEDYQGFLLWDAGCDDPTGIEFKTPFPIKREKQTSYKTSEKPEPPKKTPVEPEKKESGSGKTEKKTITRIYFPNDYSGVDYEGIASMEYIYSGGIVGKGYEMDSDFSLSGVNVSNLSMKNGNFLVDNIKCDTPDAYVREKKMFELFEENMHKTDYLFHPNEYRKPESNYIKSQSELDKHIRQVSQNPIQSKRDRLPREKYWKYISYWDVENHHLNSNKPSDADSISFKEFFEKCNATDGELKKLLDEAKEIIITGNANSHGNSSDNKILAQNRAETVLDFLIVKMKVDESKCSCTTENSNVNAGSLSVTGCSSSKSAKEGRFVKVEIIKEIKEEYLVNDADIIKPEGEFPTEMDDKTIEENSVENEEPQSDNPSVEEPLRVILKRSYDEEMAFYQYVDKNTDLTWSKIKDRYSHYIPALWSLTPEGFNGRLSFLNQCTRQGPTNSATDKTKKLKNASNLAFGRPPVCILKIGDFIQSRIYIESLSVDYKNGGQIQWDLNPEGIGIQPMMANVRISFIFTGGQDISGAIAQLQNAVTFNYYANTSVYDNRAATNGIDGDVPEKLFDPQKDKNANNYKAFLGTDKEYALMEELNKPLEPVSANDLLKDMTPKPPKMELPRTLGKLPSNGAMENSPLINQNTLPPTDFNNPMERLNEGFFYT
jgi:hypothetical protein